jgi:hypothetical protein
MDRETGVSHGCLALAGGAQRRGGRATGRSGAARPGKAPSISYMEGALLHSARQRGFCRDDTLANLAMPGGRDHLAAVEPSLRTDRRVSPPLRLRLNRGGWAESYTARLVSVHARSNRFEHRR